MKKLIFLLTFIAGVGLYSQAQVNPHAIGVRLGGDGDINGAEISYQHGMGDANRLELDLGFGGNDVHNRMYLAGIYHWDWHLTGGLNWYVGPGAGIGFYHWDNYDDYINIAIGGQIGLEFDFNTKGAPILLSIDARPMWDLTGDDHAGFGWGAALGIRYTF
jgi:opacity protein-like surface antigen